jgi:hypothetical protein
MKDNKVGDDSEVITLEAWLDESYFDGERPVDLTREDIAQFCRIVRKLLFFEPSSRTPALAISEDPWFTR